MSYFKQELLAPKYFNASFLHGQLKSVAKAEKSGYWRLLFTKLQEQALDAVNDQHTFKEQHEQSERQETKKRTRKAKAREIPVVEREEFPEVKFRRKPIYTNPQPIIEEFPIWISLISREIDLWISSIIPSWEKHKCVIIKTKDEAANDAEYRTRLLLLLAA